jgi:hypothetical protein
MGERMDEWNKDVLFFFVLLLESAGTLIRKECNGENETLAGDRGKSFVKLSVERYGRTKSYYVLQVVIPLINAREIKADYPVVSVLKVA